MKGRRDKVRVLERGLGLGSLREPRDGYDERGVEYRVEEMESKSMVKSREGSR